MIERLYQGFLLRYPKAVLFCVAMIVLVLAFGVNKLEIDASSKTLLMKHDKDLAYTELIEKRFHAPSFLVITYKPKAKLLSKTSVHTLESLSKELKALPFTKSVVSILNVPLFKSPPKPLKDLLAKLPTLTSVGTDKKLAKKEFLTSPIYSDNLVSKDFKTTAIIVNLKQNSMSHADQHKQLQQVRKILHHYSKGAQLFLGGVNVISDDMISYIKHDIKTYGIVLLTIMIVMLFIVFKELRWVVIPVIVSAAAITSSTGLFGLLGYKITVISSNFISLQLIITLSILIHLIVRYRELCHLHVDMDQKELVLRTVTSILRPSFFAIITTIAGFSSLLFSSILPVMMLGMMMSIAIAISLIIIFLSFPTLLVLMKRSSIDTDAKKEFFLVELSLLGITKYKYLIAGVSFAVLVISIMGALQLKVENSFINYFKKSTEVYKGLYTIDKSLGGTIPLDVVVTLPAPKKVVSKATKTADDSFVDGLEEQYNTIENQPQYWFTQTRMKKVMEIQNYLHSIPALGKVLSLGSVLELGRSLNDGKVLNDFQLAMLYTQLPERFRDIVLNPYVNVQKNQVRFAARVVDSTKDLNRDALIHKIQYDLTHKLGLKPENVHLSNLMILYNNMLQSLFSSQIKTLGFMLLLLAFMFFILYRTVKLTLIALIVNIIPISVVFGLLGWAKIPLDVMTITIASIGIGIAVDDTIHYLHRYKIEFRKDGDYFQAMQRSHRSVGDAIYYTSVTIMIGFFVLVFSEFMPTIYFGLLTVVVMLSALLADILLLPSLLLIFKPKL